MKQRKRIYYSPEQKALIWDRYKRGDSLHDIARMFDRFHSSIMPTIYQICSNYEHYLFMKIYLSFCKAALRYL